MTKPSTELQRRVSPHERETDLAPLIPALESLRELLKNSQAPNTTHAHERDWRCWLAWCRRRNFCPLPAETQTVALYVAELGQRLRPSTIARYLGSISVAHQAAGHDPSPTRSVLVRKALAGLKRTKGTRYRKVSPILVDELRALSKALNTGELADTRDRAMILTMFSCALRRSEAAALDVEDIEFTKKGYILTKRRSKTDQTGRGHRIAVSYGDTESCPVVALRQWIKLGKLTEGPLFPSLRSKGERLTGHYVAVIVKNTVELLGLDPAKFSGHSLRRGFITAAAQAGINERDIAAVSGHVDMKTLGGYIEEGEIEMRELTRKVGL